MNANLIPLNLPDAKLKLAKRSGVLVVWDNIRKKYLKLTPEEWVRQHFIHFLLQSGYKRETIALEGGFRLNQKLQRTDILVCKNSQPRLLIECKAPQVAVSQNTFDQASRYNLYHKAAFIAITNGLQHFCVKADYENQKYHFLNKIPDFDEL